MREILYLLAVVPILLFPVLYTILARWWETPHGRYNMMLSVALVALATPSLLDRLFGDYPHRARFVDVALITVAVAVWWRIWLLLRIQYLERRTIRRDRAARSD